MFRQDGPGQAARFEGAPLTHGELDGERVTLLRVTRGVARGYLVHRRRGRTGARRGHGELRSHHHKISVEPVGTTWHKAGTGGRSRSQGDLCHVNSYPLVLALLLELRWL